ncbi:MAG: LamG domain-containing protein, partial [Betaproteobacteria bacterium]|nr:LamG domain-containing protein [Betaproteobacteria bacterium]
ADIAYGSGLSVEGTSVTFNNVRIQGHAGVAISADLAATLTGSGNEATGNQTNAVVIPSGDILSSARLGLRGIPYLVRNGTLSVGISPAINAVEPSRILPGETLTISVTGRRLGGATQPQWSMPGLETQLLAGATDTQVNMQVTAPLNAAVGSADLTLLTDAGTVTRLAALDVLRDQPRIASIEPASVYTYSGNTVLTVNGSLLSPLSIVEVDGESLPTTVLSETHATALLSEQSAAGNRSVRLKTPDDLNAGSYLTSNAATLTVIQAQGGFNPLSASTFAGASQTLMLTIPFAAPAGGLSFTLTSASPAIAKATPTVTVPEGSRSAEFQVHGIGAGETRITASRTGWAPALLPVAVAKPSDGLASDSVASHLVSVLVGEAPYMPATGLTSLPVSVVVGQTPLMPAKGLSSPMVSVVVGQAPLMPAKGLASPLVSVSVSNLARQMTPATGVVGTSLILQVTGEGLNAVSSVQFVPPDGVTLGVPTASTDGKSLTVSVDIDASAVKSTRRVVLNTAAGPLSFTTATGDQFVVVDAGAVVEENDPYIDSVISLIDFDGEIGSTNIVDRKGLVWTPVGTAPTISDAYTLFGKPVGYFPPGNNYLQAVDSKLVLSGESYTIEFFVKLIAHTTVGYSRTIAQHGTSADSVNGIGFEFPGRQKSIWIRNAYYNVMGMANDYLTPPTEFMHIAASYDKNENNVRGFINGIQFSGFVNGGQFPGTIANGAMSSNTFRVGYAANSWLDNSRPIYIGQFRITKGVARYKGNFAPPTGPFPTH